MTTGTDWGKGPDTAAWVVRCACGATVAEGTGPAPTQADIEAMAQAHQHLNEATTGVHRLQAVTRGRVTEKKV
jgi:hypothetical protein